MKLLKKVDKLEVKRCFVMTHYVRKFGIARKTDIEIPSREKYLSALKKAKNAVIKLNEKQLDKIIGKYKRRLRAYNTLEWHVGNVSAKEISAWKGAGGLPKSWTAGSLFDTAKKVKEGLKKDSKEIRHRSKNAIPAIIKLKSIIKKEKFLFPIVLQGGVNPHIRKGLSKQVGDLDDGNMRAIAFAVSGDRNFKAYIGKTMVK